MPRFDTTSSAPGNLLNQGKMVVRPILGFTSLCKLHTIPSQAGTRRRQKFFSSTMLKKLLKMQSGNHCRQKCVMQNKCYFQSDESWLPERFTLHSSGLYSLSIATLQWQLLFQLSDLAKMLLVFSEFSSRLLRIHNKNMDHIRKEIGLLLTATYTNIGKFILVIFFKSRFCTFNY